MRFSEFFSRACPGRSAYPYQQCFAEGDSLPALLNVPTGVGKTATAVLGWLYRRHESASNVKDSTPRRLVYCLPMRTLVEQTVKCAQEWLQNLDLADKVGVHVLMGGADDSDWDQYPERDAILIGTQDMLLSKALNRGYGMSRYRWPMHFGLLNNDCLWVMDETQLMGVGLTTTAQLQGLRSKLQTYGVAHSIWMSATLDAKPITTVDHAEPLTGFARLTLSDADRKHAPVKKRLGAVKSLEKAKVVLSNDSEKKSYAKDLASAVKTAHREGTLTLIVMNRVARAQDLFRELQNLKKAKTKRAPLAAEIALIHSRFRPFDRIVQESILYSGEECGAGRIVVATQAIEAGVDVSAATMFTELAPWSSLVQRFGRCNRGGEYSDARVIWIDATLKDDKDKIALPYEAAEFHKSRQFLSSLKDVGPGALEAIHDDRPDPIVHTLRKKDLLDLWDTTPDLAGNDLDVSRFIREGDDTDVQFYWRDFADGQPPEQLPAAQRHELCSVSVGQAKEFLGKLKKNSKQFALTWKPLERKDKWQSVDPGEVRPGMVLLLTPEMGGYSREVGWTGDAADKPMPLTPADGQANEDIDDGCNLKASHWVPLLRHLNEVAKEASELKTGFKNALPEIPWDAVVTAARWHDIGKAHPAFQNMLVQGDADAANRRSAIWAKSDGKQTGRPQYFADLEKKDERIGFRHELASAISWLTHRGDRPDANLIAFLIAAHHGKVRGSIRSLPNEIPPADPTLEFARGIVQGDMLPAIDIGEGEVIPATPLDLGLMKLGGSGPESSWLSRVLSLRNDDDLGPFRLCFLETLLRVADWRGSNAGAN